MVGRHRGFLSLLRKEIPNLFNLHCVIHSQHLVAKYLSVPLQKPLGVAVKAINKIKAHAKKSIISTTLPR